MKWFEWTREESERRLARGFFWLSLFVLAFLLTGLQLIYLILLGFFVIAAIIAFLGLCYALGFALDLLCIPAKIVEKWLFR